MRIEVMVWGWLFRPGYASSVQFKIIARPLLAGIVPKDDACTVLHMRTSGTRESNDVTDIARALRTAYQLRLSVTCRRFLRSVSSNLFKRLMISLYLGQPRLHCRAMGPTSPSRSIPRHVVEQQGRNTEKLSDW